jgi:hypothetical protein
MIVYIIGVAREADGAGPSAPVVDVENRFVRIRGQTRSQMHQQPTFLHACCRSAGAHVPEHRRPGTAIVLYLRVFVSIIVVVLIIMVIILKVVSQLARAFRAKHFAGGPCQYKGGEAIRGQPNAGVLTHEEREAIEDVCTVLEYTNVYARGCLFRSVQARKSVHDNTGVMLPWVNNQGTVENAFGRIQRIYDLDLAGHKTPPLIEAEWFEVHGMVTIWHRFVSILFMFVSICL